MEISIASDVTHHPSSTSPKRQQLPVATTTSSADPVLDQFQQMRSMISTFLSAREDPTPSPRQSFCKYLHFEIEHLEERDFLTFRSETVKLLSEIQYKAEERKRQVTTSQQATTFQLPEATQATARPEYITILILRQSLFQLCSQHCHWRTCDSDCQSPATTSLITGGESTQHIRIIQSFWSYSKCATASADRHTTVIFTLSTSNSTVTSANFHSSRTVKTYQPVQPAESESAQISGLARISHTKTGPSKGHLNYLKTIKQQFDSPKTKKHTVQHLHFPTVHKENLCEYMSEC